MDKKIIEITQDEAEDIRFALGFVANANEERAADVGERLPGAAARLLEQAERFRAIARMVTR